MNTPSQFLQTAISAARRAETVILNYFQTDLDVTTKLDKSPVTQADKQAERIIIDHLLKHFPHHGIMGEESGKKSGDEYQWIIDPIDGTKNFIRGLPFFSTEIALYKGNEIVLGVSNAPALRKLLYAEKGCGAYLNHDPQALHVSTVSRLEDSYITFGGLKHFINHQQSNQLGKLITASHAYRGFGDAWSYHFLSSGKTDCMIEAQVGGIYDIAPQIVIVQEAGGKVTDIHGQPLTKQSTSIIATNGLLHDKVVQFFT